MSIRLKISLLVIGLCIVAWPSVHSSQAESQRFKRDEDLDRVWQSLKSAWASLGDFFGRQVQSVKDLFAGSKQELQTKVDETVQFLKKVKEEKSEMLEAAKLKAFNGTQTALNKVEMWYNDANAFQQKVRADTSENADALRTEWETKVTNWYNGGLDNVINMAQELKSNSNELRPTIFSLLLSTLSFFVVFFVLST